MKRSIPPGFMGCGVALLLAGCVNLAGANISNVGNGNKVDADIKTGDIGSGNKIGINPGSADPGMNFGPVVSLGLDSPGYRLYRLSPNTDLSNLQFDFNLRSFVSKDNFNGISPSPDFKIDPGEGFTLTARGTYQSGAAFDIGKDMMNGSDWKLQLPPGIEAKSDYMFTGPFNGSPPILLIARSEAATGSYEIRLVNQRDANCPVATAALEVLDRGSVDVSF